MFRAPITNFLWTLRLTGTTTSWWRQLQSQPISTLTAMEAFYRTPRVEGDCMLPECAMAKFPCLLSQISHRYLSSGIWGPHLALQPLTSPTLFWHPPKGEHACLFSHPRPLFTQLPTGRVAISKLNDYVGQGYRKYYFDKILAKNTIILFLYLKINNCITFFPKKLLQ